MKKLKIAGVIIPNDYQDVYDWFGIEAASPKIVEKALAEANGEELEIELNSPGGSVTAGSEIYSRLKSYAGKVTVKIIGIAASAASVIAMAADRVQISPTAQIMIHNVSCIAAGDYREMEQTAETLKNYNVSISNAYQLKTGLDQDQLLDLMNKETYFNAQRAKELGFVDEILFDQSNLLVASGSPLLPIETVNKIKNMLAEEKTKAQAITEAEIAAEGERIALLKLRGVS